MKRRWNILASLLLTSALLAGCTPSSTSDGQAPEGTEEGGGTETSEQTDPDEKIELNFWDLRTEGAGAEMIDTLIANFEKELSKIAKITKHYTSIASFNNFISHKID